MRDPAAQFLVEVFEHDVAERAGPGGAQVVLLGIFLSRSRNAAKSGVPKPCRTTRMFGMLPSNATGVKLRSGSYRRCLLHDGLTTRVEMVANPMV